MFTRDDNLYLKLFLQTIGCKNITILDPDKKSDDLICGFSSLSSMIGEDIARAITPQRMYCANTSQYIAIFSKCLLRHFLMNRFIDLTRSLLSYCNGDYDLEYGFKFGNEEAYQNFIKRPRNTVLEKLRAAGIDHGDYAERIVIPGFGFSYTHPFSGLSIDYKHHYYLHVFDVKKFFEKTSLFNLEKQQERAQRQTFLNGIESKTSSVNVLNRNVTKLILQFHSTLQKKSIFNTQTQQCGSEKPSDVMAINKLLDMIDLLKDEILNEEDALKKNKVAFLQLVLALRRSNAHFGLRDCLSIAKQSQPALYNQAIQGYFSRTRKVLDAIETNRSRISL